MTMRKIIPVLVFLLLSGQAFANDDVVLGVVGMDPVESTSCVAVFIPLQDGQALAGVEWYNNDGTVNYPEIVVTGGTANDPGGYSAGYTVIHNVYGQSSSWSQVQWDGTYRCDAGGVYVIFRLPVSSVYVSEGAGGGAAVGYQTADKGAQGWLSIDGQEWIALHTSLGLAFRSITAAADQETVILFRAQKSLGNQIAESAGDIVLQTGMRAPYPNPFNPMTKLQFTLAEALAVDLEIYDIRGQLVKRLVNQVFSAGDHVVKWMGQNNQGREVSSGVYLARFRAGSLVQTHRLLLVR